MKMPLDIWEGSNFESLNGTLGLSAMILKSNWSVETGSFLLILSKFRGNIAHMTF